MESCVYMLFDALIIGGGASGLCCAIKLKQLNTKLNVGVLEQLSRVGKKLIVTGNGRCNITNENIDFSRYHSENPEFFEYALSHYDNSIIEEYFEEMGINFVYDDTGRAYPYSLQASSVVDALRFTAENLGIKIITDTEVTDFSGKFNNYKVVCDKETFSAKTLVVATGLFSGGAKMGSNGKFFYLLCKKGYNFIKTYPAIVQLRTKTDIVRQLKGIKVNADAQLFIENRLVSKEYGDVLFCDYGLSGPPILQLSGYCRDYSDNIKVSLDLMPEYPFNELYDLLLKRKDKLSYRNCDEFLTGLLNKRLGQVVVKQIGVKMTDSVVSLKNHQLKTIASIIKGMQFDVVGNTGFDNSQVSGGGLDTCEFDSKTMMSKKDMGLFAIGEILDVYGDCGGFNLRWAWSSGMCAADAVANLLDGGL